MERDLILMALNQLKEAEKERKLNTAQKRRRRELKIKLKSAEEIVSSFKEEPSELLNKKDKRKLTELDFKILKSLKDAPNVTQRGIYIEDHLVKVVPKKVLTALVSWGYVNKSEKNRYSITRQGKWRLNQLKKEIERKKKREELKRYKEIVVKLEQAKKNLPILKKRKEDIQEKHRKLMETISEKSKEEYEKHKFDWEYHTDWDPKTKTSIKFKWSNPKEIRVIMSIRETRGWREKAYRKAYDEYYDTKKDIKYYEKEIKKFKGTYKEKKRQRTIIEIEMDLQSVITQLDRDPNDSQLKKLERELRLELREAYNIESERRRKTRSPFD